MRSATDEPRLCFVLAPAFHGATLLALLLNNHSQVTALGDTVPKWNPESVCSCGVGFCSCSFWQTVSARLDTSRYAHLPLILPDAPWPLEGAPGESALAVLRRRLAYKLWQAELHFARRGVPLISAAARRPLKSFASTCSDFYELLCELHGTSVVVDGTKSVEKFRSLRRHYRETVDIPVIHLVRDPRGFARSWRANIGEALPVGATHWRDFHSRVARTREANRVLTVRYEDVCGDPRQELERVFAFLALESEDVVGPPRYPKKHHLVGNKMLLSFTGVIHEDERWRSELTLAEERRVLSGAGPLAQAYGYK